jgi:tetratricopeptide (TPR) repeat protein
MAFEEKSSKSISQLNRLDQVCDRFERAWKEGSSPRIEDYLVQVAEAERAELLRELLSVEIYHRLQRGEKPAADEYLTRFPQLDRAALEAELAVGPSSRQADPLGATVQQTPSGGMTPPGPGVRVRYLGDYELLEEVARGGMGVVYKARQISLNRIVGVKMILAGLLATKADHDRFHSEAQAAAILDHPNIVPVYEVGEFEGQHYFSMGYVDGQSLTARLTDGPMPPKEAAELVAEVARAVEYAHRHGVIHRDIKPSNIIIDSTGRPRITDFGLAKRVDSRSELTATGQVLGTPSYMAPEQAAGQIDVVGPAADVYALGALLYTSLTGRPPFQAATSLETLQQVLDREPLALRQINPAVPRDLETIVLMCLEKSIPRRYASAEAFADDLRRYLEGRPILARPVGRLGHAWRWCRRQPVVACLIAGVVLTLVAGIVGTSRGMVEARRQAFAADQARDKAQKRLRQIEKSNEIVLSIFKDIDIRKIRQGPDPLEAVLAQRLLKVVEELHGEVVGEPLMVARLQNRLGETLMGLGHAKAAVPLLEKCRQTYVTESGEDDPETLASMMNLGMAYQFAGELNKAFPLLEETLKRRKVILGPDHLDTIDSMNSLGIVYRAAGKLALAVPMFEETLKLYRIKLGADDPNTLTSMNNLAAAYQAAGQLDRALPLFEETLKRRKVSPGPDDFDTLMSMNNLGQAYQAAGRLDLALPLLEETLKRRKIRLGPNHPDTLRSMSNLGHAYQAARKLDLALPLFKEALEVRKATLGPDHPDTLTSMNNLAAAYQAAGMNDLALPLMEETLRLIRIKLPPDHPYTLACMNNLAMAYQAARKSDLALPLLEETLKLIRAKLGPEHSYTLMSMDNLGLAYQAAGKVDQALPLLQAAAVGMEKHQFPESADVVVANLINCCERMQHFDEAERWRRKWAAVVRQRSGPDSMPYADELAMLGRNLLAQQNWHKAEEVLRECLAIREKLQPEAWNTFNTRALLGGALLGHKEYAQAEPLLRQGYLGMKQRAATIPPPFRSYLTDALTRLVQLYDAWGKTDEAVIWRKELDAAKELARLKPEPEGK